MVSGLKKQKMNYKLIKPTNLKEIISCTEKFSTKNIIIDLTELETSLEEIIPFKKIANSKTENDTSFVIINTTINIDKLSDEINIVPTLQEAIDVIEMDEIMRKLE